MNIYIQEARTSQKLSEESENQELLKANIYDKEKVLFRQDFEILHGTVQ